MTSRRTQHGGDEDATSSPPPGTQRMRVDKWLWCARFYRTRTLAADAVAAGQVRVDGERVKPAQAIGPGAMIEVRRQTLAWTVEVLGLATQRGPASEAVRLYRETEASSTARAEALAARARARGSGRPTKKERRRLEDFLNEP